MNSVFRFFIVALITISTPAPGNVILQGKILHYDGTSIVYYRPTIEGIHTYHWFEIKPSANGSFRIEFENQGFGTTTIGYRSHEYRFFHDENSKIEITIDQNKMHRKHPVAHFDLHRDSSRREALVAITGSHQDVNRFYNANLRTAYSGPIAVDGNFYSLHLASSTDPAQIRRRIDSLTTMETDQIRQLRVRIDSKDPSAHDRAVDERIKSFLTNEVRAYYGGVFLNAMFQKRKEEILARAQDSTTTPGLYDHTWEKLIEQFAVDVKTKLTPAVNSSDYNNMLEALDYTMQNYRRYEFPQTSEKSPDELLVDVMINYDTSIFTTPGERYAHELRMMKVYLNSQMYFSPELLNIVYDIESRHRDSPNFDSFKAEIDHLKEYLIRSEKPFNKATIISSRHNTFASLLGKLQGKYILVDVWATWCHPCIEQFKHKNRIQHFIDSGKIEVLYISTDKAEWADRWKKSIRFNQLEGSHFRADQKFIVDMWNTLKGFEGAIPRYALVDKTGKVYNATASRPGDGDRLVKEIEAMLAEEQHSSEH